MTYLIFIFLLIFSVTLANQAQCRERKSKMIVIALLLSFVGGFRAFSVGYDTESYRQLFVLIQRQDFVHAYGLETSFKILCYLLMKVCDSPTFLFLFFATITHFCVVLRLWDYRYYCSMSWAIAIYCIVFYFLSLNIMRQMCAVAIVFYFSRYIDKNKYHIFILGVLIASLFHKSALLGFALFASEVLYWKTLTRLQKVFIGTGILSCPIVIKYLFDAANSYSNYFTNKTMNIGILITIELVLFAGSLLLNRKSYLSFYDNGYMKKEDQRTFCSSSIFYLIGIALTGLGYIFRFMDRIGLYFYIFGCVYVSMIVFHGKYRSLIKVGYFLLFLLLFVLELINGSQGEIPYLFVWQQR